MASTDPHSGTGGYALLLETVLPVVHDPNTREGRDALNLLDLEGGNVRAVSVSCRATTRAV